MESTSGLGHSRLGLRHGGCLERERKKGRGKVRRKEGRRKRRREEKNGREEKGEERQKGERRREEGKERRRRVRKRRQEGRGERREGGFNGEAAKPRHCEDQGKGGERARGPCWLPAHLKREPRAALLVG